MARNQKPHRESFGSVRKLKSGRYQARYTAPDGTKRSLGTFPTKTEARQRIAREQVAIAGGVWRDRDQGGVRLDEYVETWLRSRADIRDRTRALHERMLRVWIAGEHPAATGPHRRVVSLGPRRIDSVTPADVREWFSAVTAASAARAESRHVKAKSNPTAVNRAVRTWARASGLGVAATGRIPHAVKEAWAQAGGAVLLDLDPPPINAGKTEAAQAYRLLKAAMTVAVEEGVIVSNPCTIKRAGEVSAAERVPATVPQVAAIACAMPDRYGAAVWVAAFSGLRHGELFALQRRHVDLQTGRIRVEQALEMRGSARVFGPPKSTAALRSVTIGEPALGHLRRHVDTFVARRDDALIFSTSSGRPVYGIGPLFARAREAAGRPELRWHDLRHTGATLALQTGANFVDVQARMGHATMDAARRYLHTHENRDDLIAERMAAQAAQEISAAPSTSLLSDVVSVREAGVS